MKRVFGLLLCLAAGTALAQKFGDLAQTPPMGWNSWNRFGCQVNEALIRQAADAMVKSGMQQAGYQYIVIDDCWQVGRDKDGNILPDPQRFPSGMKALADYVHSRGLKFGVYSDAGTATCQNRPGSRGYEFQDARAYASCGVDYLKYDWCNVSTQDAPSSYTLMRDALYKAGRPVVFSICEWGLSKPWLWAQEVGHLWRTTGDITNSWTTPDAKEGKVWGGGALIILDMQQGLEKFAGPGHWNDADMLEVGNGVLTDSESRAHFSLWCMLSSPLMAGNDLGNMSESTRTILTNAETIAINQDPLGQQASKVRTRGLGIEVWLKRLQGGDWAVCFLNREDKARDLALEWKQLGVEAGLKIRDVWKKADLGVTEAKFTATVPSHDVVMLRLQK
jgi:alpha-galactosidase